MNIVIWLALGGLIGWVASMFMGTDDRQGIILNVVLGIAGSALGGWLFSNVFNISTINQGNLRVGGMAVSLIGAVILIATFKLIRRT